MDGTDDSSSGAAHFRAPWDTRVKVITGGVVGLGIALHYLVGGPAGAAILVLVALSALFAPRGYSVAPNELVVHRFGWASRFPLGASATAEWAPGATAGSIRTFGNGGLFGFVGRFRNGILGNYRAFATDSSRMVVVRTATIAYVVTPDDPDRFVRAVQEALPSAGDP